MVLVFLSLWKSSKAAGKILSHIYLISQLANWIFCDILYCRRQLWIYCKHLKRWVTPSGCRWSNFCCKDGCASAVWHGILKFQSRLYRCIWKFWKTPDSLSVKRKATICTIGLSGKILKNYRNSFPHYPQHLPCRSNAVGNPVPVTANVTQKRIEIPWNAT